MGSDIAKDTTFIFDVFSHLKAQDGPLDIPSDLINLQLEDANLYLQTGFFDLELGMADQECNQVNIFYISSETRNEARD